MLNDRTGRIVRVAFLTACLNLCSPVAFAAEPTPGHKGNPPECATLVQSFAGPHWKRMLGFAPGTYPMSDIIVSPDSAGNLTRMREGGAPAPAAPKPVMEIKENSAGAKEMRLIMVGPDGVIATADDVACWVGQESQDDADRRQATQRAIPNTPTAAEIELRRLCWREPENEQCRTPPAK